MLQNSFNKIGRLAIGIVVSILISLWIHDELTQSDKNYKQVAQIMQRDWFNGRKKIDVQSNTTLLGTKLRTIHKDNFIAIVHLPKKASYIIFNVDKKPTQSGGLMESNIRTYFIRELLTRDSLRQGNSLSLLRR